MRSVIFGLIGAVVAAGSSILLSLLWQGELDARVQGTRQDRASDASALVSVALAARERASVQRIRALCESDIHVERLSLMLATSDGDGRAEAAQVTLRLSRSFEAVPMILRQQGQRLERLAGNAKLSIPDAATLEAMRTRWVATVTETRDVWLMSACRRGARPDALWIVIAWSAQELLAPFAEHTQVSPTLLVGDTDGHEVDREGTPRGWAARDASGRILARLAERPGPSLQHDSTRLLFALCALASAALGALMGFAYARKTRLHEQALDELERALSRVAEGDLTSSIGVTLEGHADQTFRTFDRMTRELREMRSKLLTAEREAAFRDVAQRIAHEIKNPLSPIQLSIETLRKARARKLADFDEIFEESTRAILDEVRRLERIVRDFSAYARLPKPRPGALDVGALIKDVLTLHRPEDVAVDLELADALPQIRADRDQLTQVLVNLLKNAGDAVAERATPRIALRVEAWEKGVCVHVDDNGPGVAEEERERIFEPYFTQKEQGTGLGLSIVKRIVTEHGGVISVSQGPLGGARFSVRLSESGPP